MALGESGLVDRGSSDRRRVMVDGQIRTFDVTDQRVLESFYRIPRETALPPALVPFAYSDAQIVLPSSRPGTDGRALLQPMFLAKLLQSATIQPDDKVLVVAGATGYAAAVVAALAGSVVSLESDPAFSTAADSYLATLGLKGRVTVVTGALGDGHAANAPYHRIIVNGAVERGLEPLFAQLAPGGCLVAMVTKADQASRRSGKAMRFDKIGNDISSRGLFDATVPVLDAFREHAAFVF